MNKVDLFKYDKQNTMSSKIITAILIIEIIVSLGCKEKPPQKVDHDGTLKIDLTQGIHEIPFVINSITGDLRLIRLEANSNSFISYFNGFIGKKFIISINSDKVILFSSTGSYKCTIAKNGKGPNDFTGIDGWDVDSEEKYLYFHDYGRNYINKYNLKTGKFENNVPFKGTIRITNLRLIHDTSICVLPYIYSGSELLFYYQNLSGLITGGIKKEPTSHKGPWAGRTPVFNIGTDKSILFHPSESDTVFKIIGNDLHPFITISKPVPQIIGNVTTGTNVSFNAISNNKILLLRTYFEITQTDKALGINSKKIEYLIFDTIHQVASIINPFYLDYSGIRIICPMLVNIINDNQFLAVYQALEFNNQLNEALKKEIDIKKRSIIEGLIKETNENDNPIIIVGTIN